MRLTTLALLITTATASFAQPGTCDDLVACFTPVQSGPGAVAFANCTQPGTNIQYVWHFGDETMGSDASPTHTYPGPGTYNVCLVAYWNDCVDEFCLPIVVEGGDPCTGLQAGFAFQPSGGGYQFSNTTTGLGEQTTWSWSFGDDGHSDNAQPFHEFAEPGTYTVCLLVVTVHTSPNGVATTCADDYCAEVTVGGGDPCADLVACFTSSQSGPGAISFVNCTVPSTNIQYVWHFGDETTGSDASPTHTYPGPGTYNVCLVAYWNNCVDEFCVPVIVEGGDPCADLHACFETDHLQGSAYLFTNCSSAPGDGDFVWHFGDGGSSTSTNADHLYQEPGTYEVCLNATWGNCTDEICHTVIVEGGDPCDGFAAGFTFAPSGGGFQFSNTTTALGDQTTWYWSFGDDTHSDNAQPFHEFAQPGTYNVCLSVVTIHIGPNGAATTCTDDYCDEVIVQGGDPCADLVACFTSSQSGPGNIAFANCTQPSTNIQYVWHFGDETTGSDASPTHTYPGPGTYNVCLVAYWNNCVDEFCVPVIVEGDDPCAGLEACFNVEPLENGAYFFENCSTEPSNAQFLWHFDDGTTTNGVNADHVFLPGSHEVCLTVYWGQCEETICHTFVVDGPPGCDPDFAVDFTWSAQGTAVIFMGTATRDVDGMHWNFGDGTDGSTSIITHLYEPPGPYEVCFSAYYLNTGTGMNCQVQHCELVDPFNMVGINAIALDDVAVFPVPARDVLMITGLSPNAHIRLFSLDGQLVLAERAVSNTHRISVSDVTTGSYVLRVDMNGRSMYRKVIVE